MNSFSVEKNVPYYDQIYNSIKQMIIQGIFQPGERIFEAKIARDFNVSRSPVREAIRVLENEGLIFVDEKSRIKVYKPTAKDVEEIYQCRMVLESLAVVLTTQLATPKELDEIEKILEQAENYLNSEARPNKEFVNSLNSRFHELIRNYSRNSRLQRQLQDLYTLTYFFMYLNLKGEKREWIVLNEHKEIFNLMKKKDEKNASRLMERHIASDLIHLKKVLKKEKDI